jgi:signal transduction histidine kinase
MVVPGRAELALHAAFLSLIAVYGVRRWSARIAIAALAAVAVLTIAAATVNAASGYSTDAELYEIPFAVVIFAAMVWHVEGRERALATAGALAAERTELLERQRGQVADASHELATPIQIARGHVELLRRDPDVPAAEVEDTCAVVLEELDRIERVARQLVRLEQLDLPAPADARTDADDLLDGVERRWTRVSGGRVVVERETGGQFAALPADLEALVDALVDNALGHGSAATTVTVRAEAGADCLYLVVGDDGAGIAPEHLPHLFDRYFRPDPSRARATGGAGLGLALVRATARRYGGDVDVRSAPSAGTTFRVRLPGRADADDALPGRTAPRSHPA